MEKGPELTAQLLLTLGDLKYVGLISEKWKNPFRFLRLHLRLHFWGTKTSLSLPC